MKNKNTAATTLAAISANSVVGKPKTD